MPGFESSIVIPAFNKWDLTRRCLKSIAATTDRSNVEVIVVDNASSDATQKGCQFLGRQLFGDSFQYIRNDENRNFAGASNRGAHAARGEFVIFLNNDTEVQPGWYQPLIQDFATYPDIAATGPLLVYPEEGPLGKLVQHLGVYVNPFYLFGHLYRGIPAKSPLAGKRRFFQAITAACMVIRKKLFLEIGGFDENFINGFEDVDLCGRLWSKGWRMTVNPDAVVLHYESQTPGRHNYEDHNRQYLENKSLCFFLPDWEIHLKNDELVLQVTKWLSLQAIMPEKKTRELGHLLPHISTEDLKNMIVANPFWREGWEDLLERDIDNNERHALGEMFITLFSYPESILKLANTEWARQDANLLGSCIKKLSSFANPSSDYLECARDSMKWCTSHKMENLALQCAAFIENYQQFSEQNFPALAKNLKYIGDTFTKLTGKKILFIK